MTLPAKTFRLQFIDELTSPREHRPAVLGERNLAAADIDAALREAACVPWPTGARACRLSGLEDREVAYRFRQDAGRRRTTIVKFA